MVAQNSSTVNLNGASVGNEAVLSASSLYERVSLIWSLSEMTELAVLIFPSLSANAFTYAEILEAELVENASLINPECCVELTIIVEPLGIKRTNSPAETSICANTSDVRTSLFL